MDKDFAHSPGRRAAALVLLWLAGTCLRLTVLAVPPVVPLLHRDLHLTETGIGWLSSLPPMLFAIAAIPGALLIARLGIVPALVVGLLLNGLGSAMRGLLPDATLLYASSVVMAAGVSVMQPALPPLVRAWFPDRIGFATAIYTTGLLVGEILAASLTIPVVLPLVGNSWRLNFVFWSLPVFATAALIVIFVPRLGGAGHTAPAAARRWWPDWRRPLIWKLGLMLGSVNATYFVTNAFLPDYMTSQGRPDLIASALTAVNLGQLPAAFLMLGFAGRLVTRPWAYALFGSLSLGSVIGMLTMHGLWVVFWVAILGFTASVILILALALPSMLSAPDDVHRTSAGMFTISYSVAMALSVIGGWLWDSTHSPVIGFLPAALGGIIVIALASTVREADRRYQPAAKSN